MMRKPPQLDPQVLDLLRRIPSEEAREAIMELLTPKTKYVKQDGKEGFQQLGEDNFLVYPEMEEQINPLMQALMNKQKKRAKVIGPHPNADEMLGY